MTATLARRLGAVERRMGITGSPLDQFSDADLDARWIGSTVRLAEQGNPGSIARTRCRAMVGWRKSAHAVRSGRTVDSYHASPPCAGRLSTRAEALRDRRDAPTTVAPRSCPDRE